MKKKMLIVGITMNLAGTEKSFVNFTKLIDFNLWDVKLLLAKKEGPLLDQIPKQIKIEEMSNGDIFLINRNNAKKSIWYNYFGNLDERR